MYTAMHWLPVYEITISNIYRSDVLVYFIIHFFLMMTGSYTSQGLIQSTLDVRWPKKVRKLLRNIKISSRTSKKICRRMERLERKEYVKGFSTRKQRPNYKWAFIPQHWWQWKSLWKYFSKRNRQFIEYIRNNWMLYGVLIDFVKLEVIAQNKDVKKL